MHLENKEVTNIKNKNNNKCTKTEHGYSFYIKCDCGFDMNVAIFYYDWFRRCPNCGAKIIKRKEDKG